MITIHQFEEALKAKVLIGNANNVHIAHVIIDSRKLIFTEQAVFIAIKGIRNDGHKYLSDVYNSGVRLFILEKGNYEKSSIESFQDATVLETESGVHALHVFAKLFRNQFNLEVLGITGSNGKTIIKEWLCHLLKDEKKLVRSPKSYNSQIGVPLSVLQIHSNHDFGIFEAGISEPNEMEKLEQIIYPTYGILTMLGDAHNEGFESMSEKLQEKAKLFKHCKLVLYGEEQTLVYTYFEMLNMTLVHKKYLGWSRTNPQADFFIKVEILALNTHLTCKQHTVQIPYTDEASIWNACNCLAFLLMLNIPIGNLKEKFSDLPTLDMRLQLKEAHLNSILINDSYSADLGSLKIALELMSQQQGGQKKTVILSDFLESGKSEIDLYSEISKQLDACQVDQIIGVGELISRNKDLFTQKEKFFFSSIEALMTTLQVSHFSNQIILIKGARSFYFEKLSKWLEKKVHQTVFEVNLNTLVENLNLYRSLLKPKVKTMAMVKAFSYGSGSFEIARMLSFNRIDYLTVAYADEGVVLREAGIKTPIMVMNPEPGSFDAILRFNLEPELYNFEILESLLIAADGEEVGIHLELDSGMKRLGFDADQLPRLLDILQANPNLKVKSIFTHLAASEDPSQDDFTLNQIQEFQQNSSFIQTAFSYPILLHCLNTGGITRFPNAQFDMVRLGIGLYGINPTNQHLNITPVGTLKTVISQIRNIASNESIGYGRRGRLAQSGKIAIVAIGYADGLDRKLSNGIGSMLINGKLAPIVGSICMDMTMLDISQIDCKVGDEVVVFGENPSINALSDQVGTIPYEILTNISQRVKRVFYV